MAASVAKHAKHQPGARLRVGYTPDTVPSILSHALRRFTKSTPGVELVLEPGTTPGLIEDTRDGRLDVAAVCLPAATGQLRVTRIAREHAVAAVTLMHRLADLPEIDFERLTDSTLLLMPRGVNPAFFDGVVAEAGMEGLNRVWSRPEALPSPAELQDPAQWLERMRTKSLEPAV